MRFAPIMDRIIVRERREGAVTSSGFLVPDIARVNKPYVYADVLAVGTGRVNLEGKTAPLVVREGDVVMLPRRSQSIVVIPDPENDNAELLLLREADVLAVVHDMPVPTMIAGVDGKLLSMAPVSRGLIDLSDTALKNEEDLQRAERLGFVDKSDGYVDPYKPGDGPDTVVARQPDQGHDEVQS